MTADGNAFAGQARNVVQAETIYGGVHGVAQQTLPVPRQLPRSVTCFTDRTDAIIRLNETAATENGIVMISGPAGVGKSALAVFWAHAAREKFSDGQLYINLRGYDRFPPLRPEEALHGFLSALSAPVERLHGDPDAMSAHFRSLADGKRLLVVADNASSAEQVRPLLPSSPGCFTIVTSRNRLTSLAAVEGATPLPIAPLATSEAVDLFRRLSRHEDRERTTQLVLRCGRLPLTIRIAAQQAHTLADLSELIEEVTGNGDRLGALSTLDEGAEVRTVFSWSYQGLPPSHARAFRLLALHAGPDFSTRTAAALTGLPVNDARRILRALASVNLLEEIGDRRYRYHDLLRDYALERAMEEEAPGDRASALRRELSFYVWTADAADRVLSPERQHVPIDRTDPVEAPLSFENPHAALAWCDSELPSLRLAVDQAVEQGFDDVAWKLPVALVYFLRLRRHDTYRFELSTIAVEAARRAHDRWAEAWSLICLGGIESDVDRHEEAVGHFTEALRISREINDRRWEANSIYNLAWTLRLLGRHDEALVQQRQALLIQRQQGDRRSEAITLTEIGALELLLGRPAAARTEYERALAGARETADLTTEGKSLHGLGDVCRSSDAMNEAIEWYESAIGVRRRSGDLFGQARSLLELGKQLSAAGRPDVARQATAEALAILDDIQSPMAEGARQWLAANLPEPEPEPEPEPGPEQSPPQS